MPCWKVAADRRSSPRRSQDPLGRRDTADRQSCLPAEEDVEGANPEGRSPTLPATRWQDEIGKQPEPPRTQAPREAMDEAFDLGGRETIEDEERHDGIVGRGLDHAYAWLRRHL